MPRFVTTSSNVTTQRYVAIGNQYVKQQCAPAYNNPLMDRTCNFLLMLKYPDHKNKFLFINCDVFIYI